MAERLDILEGSSTKPLNQGEWVLRGTTSNTRYTNRTEVDALVSKQAGLMRGGPCDVRVLDDGRQSLLITPRPQKRRGALGLLAHLESQTVAFPKVKRHTMPFK
jgi:hypothetical protein